MPLRDTRRPRRLLLTLLALPLLLTSLPTAGTPAAAGAAASPPPALVPQPVHVVQPGGEEPWTLRPGARIAATGEARPIADLLAAELRRSTGYRLPVLPRPRPGDVAIRVDPEADYTVAGDAPTEESYRLEVTTDGVQLTALTARGAFNGVQTLRQLMPAWVGSPVPVLADWEVSATVVEDAPRFGYRGVMLDVARSFQEVDMVKRYIDTLSGFKLSHLHLHLADDQGWRIEITNEGRVEGDTIDYTRLTDVSGGTAMNERGYREELGRSGYYTQEEYREIVAYARERFVTVVPEIDVPGHTNSALHAIGELNTDRSLPAPDPETGLTDWNGTADVGYSALDEQHAPTYDFVEHVFTQLAEMTEGPLVHVGGDESLAMGHERYVDFVSRAVPLVREATGTGVMGWTEYAEAGLSEGPGYWDGSIVQYWVGSGDWVRDFVAKGGKAVVSEAGASYTDMKYDPTTPIGLTWACSGDCDFPRYYDWDPTTVVEGGVPEEGILGVEAPMWSETLRGEDQARYMALPRAAAILETGWSRAEDKDVAGFSQRLAGLGPHLTAAGSNFYESRRAAWGLDVAGLAAETRPRTETLLDVGLVAAPGTKLGAAAGALLVDRSDTDGDPASDSVLTEPLTAVLECGSQTHPVTFATEQGRDELNGAAVYRAQVRAAFTATTSCTLVPSVGDPAPVTVRVGRVDPEPPPPVPGPLTVVVGDGSSTVADGSWVPFRVGGASAEAYLDVLLDDELVYRLRADEAGDFARSGLIPPGTGAGSHTLTVREGERQVSVELQVTD